jgi:hypothetical protein
MEELAGELGYDGEGRIGEGAWVLEMRIDAEDLQRAKERPGHHRKVAGVEGLRVKTVITIGMTSKRERESLGRGRRMGSSPDGAGGVGVAVGWPGRPESKFFPPALETERAKLAAIGEASA